VLLRVGRREAAALLAHIDALLDLDDEALTRVTALRRVTQRPRIRTDAVKDTAATHHCAPLRT
jgi:hypothetical protein